MRFEWFEVQGYKNIQRAVRLDLGRFEVLHGENNVGKSNILEAMGLFFVLLAPLREDVRGGPGLAESFARKSPASGSTPGRSTSRSTAYFTDRGFPPGEIFHRRAPAPIELRARVRLAAADLAAVDPSWLAEPIEIGLRLTPGDDELMITLAHLARTNAPDSEGPEEREAAPARVIERLGPRPLGVRVAPRFALIRADRTVLADLPPAGAEVEPLVTRGSLPNDLGLLLNDAQGSAGPDRERFNRFIAALDRFQDLTGEGTWRVQYDRREDRADLVLEQGGTPIPLHLMGSGIQQIAVLLARLVMTRADVVAVEEPEENLRWSAQERLREALRALVDGGDVSQLLLTSHSGAFEVGPKFFLIERSPHGPRATQRPAEEAPQYTGPEVVRPPPGARAPVSYVTTEGLVRLPDDVRERLGLTQGGGVVFVQEKEHGHQRMLTDEQFLDLFERQETKP